MRLLHASSSRRAAFWVAALLFGLARASSAQALSPSVVTPARDDATRRPRLVTRAGEGRIAAQIIVGALTATAFGVVAWSRFEDPHGPDRRVRGDAGYTPNANTAWAAASFVGATLATYLVGRADGSRGSFAATALGAAIASIPGALGRHNPYLPLAGTILWAPLQGIGGTIGYQVTRRAP